MEIELGFSYHWIPERVRERERGREVLLRETPADQTEMGKAETIIINEEEGFLSWFSLFIFFALVFPLAAADPRNMALYLFSCGNVKESAFAGMREAPRVSNAMDV